MRLPVHNLAGEAVGELEASDLVFGIEPNLAVMHQALLRQQANGRAGTHNTRTRAHVAGGGKKPYRQKGTGHARQGSIRSPQYRGGGVVFGPHPRSYAQQMPRKMRRLALRSALSQKVHEQRLVVLRGLEALEPRARIMMALLGSVGARSALVATGQNHQPAAQAGGNLRGVRVLQAANLNIADLLKYDYLVLDESAVQPLTEVLLDGVGSAGTDRPDGENAAEGEV